MIAYQEISLTELKQRIVEIDVSERGSVVYYWIDNEVECVPEEWERPKKSDAAWESDSWNTILDLEGVRAWGAIDLESNQLAGVIVYRPHLTDDTAQLAALFTDKDHRRASHAAIDLPGKRRRIFQVVRLRYSFRVRRQLLSLTGIHSHTTNTSRTLSTGA